MKRIYTIILTILAMSLPLMGQQVEGEGETGWVEFYLGGEELQMYLDFEGEVQLQGLVDPPEKGVMKTYHKGKGRNPDEVIIWGALTTLKIPNSQVSGLSLILHRTLHTLDCSGNDLMVMSIDRCRRLRTLDCSNNRLETLYLNGETPELRKFDCSNNNLRASGFDFFIKELPVCPKDDRGKLYVKDLTRQDKNFFSTENASVAKAKNWDVYAYSTDERGNRVAVPYEGEGLILENIITYTTPLPVGTQITYDLEAEGDVIADGLTNVNIMRGHMKSVILKQTASIKGDVKLLSFYGIPFTEMDLSKNKTLIYAESVGGLIKELDFSNSENITAIRFSYNQLETINIENTPNLGEIRCYNNNLSLEAVREIVNNLPDRSFGFPVGHSSRPAPADLRLINLTDAEWPEHNAMPTVEMLEIAEQKNWEIKILQPDPEDEPRWMKITEQDITGIAHPESGQLSISPNPAGDYVSITGAEAYATARLVDLQGQTLVEDLCDDNGTLKLDVRVAPIGNYLLIINGASYKLIISR